jgi:hypothetical protein
VLESHTDRISHRSPSDNTYERNVAEKRVCFGRQPEPRNVPAVNRPATHEPAGQPLWCVWFIILQRLVLQVAREIIILLVPKKVKFKVVSFINMLVPKVNSGCRSAMQKTRTQAQISFPIIVDRAIYVFSR